MVHASGDQSTLVRHLVEARAHGGPGGGGAAIEKYA